MSSTIRGVVPPLAVPLKDGELDVPSLERHINRMIEAGLDGLFVSGSTGEVAFSTTERRAQIQREAVRIVDGRIPLLVGVIDTETERVLENIKVVEEIGGATGVVATAPFYALGGETEVERPLPYPQGEHQPRAVGLRHPRVRAHEAVARSAHAPGPRWCHRRCQGLLRR